MRLYKPKEWPHGLRCTICSHRFEEGETIFNKPVGQHAFVAEEDHVSIVKVVCRTCAA